MKLERLKLKLFLPLLLTTYCQFASAQQDIQFSQYVFNGLSVNPAYAGYKEDVYLNSTYRKQWVNFPGSPETGTLSIDGLLNPDGTKTVGLGGQVMWDKLGPQESLSFYGSYAYRIQLNSQDDSRLSFGLGLGINQYSINGDKFAIRDPDDLSIPIGKLTSTKPNANFGAYYYNPKFYAGFAVLDLLQSNTSNNVFVGSNSYDFVVIRKTRHYYLTAGSIFDLSDGVKLKPSFMIKDDFKGPTNLDLNTFFLFGERLYLGASYRTGIDVWKKNHLQNDLEKTNAMSLLTEILATDRFRIGYSYDFTTSKLSNYQNGSHEISLGILLFNKKKERIYSPRYF